MSTDSPYLIPNRLFDLMTAIQFLGAYRWYKLRPDQWEAKMSVTPVSAQNWNQVFKAHPEFFRISQSASDAGQVSLVLRRAKPRDAEKSGEHPHQQRPPLEADIIAMLMETAIRLRADAEDLKRDQRWWLTPAVGLFTALIGFAGVLIGMLFSCP